MRNEGGIPGAEGAACELWAGGGEWISGQDVCEEAVTVK